MHTVRFDHQASRDAEQARKLAEELADSKRTWAEEKQQLLHQKVRADMFMNVANQA
jgi:ubiquitin